MGAGGGGTDYVDGLVVGGGFFGASLAVALARLGERVAVIERGRALLLGASSINQARIHRGYHYPRSVLTALRSRINAPRFAADHADCVVDDFEHYYAIARPFSKVTAHQFQTFCARIGAPLTQAPDEVRRLFHPDLIEEVFVVREGAFDANRLRRQLIGDLDVLGVSVRLETTALRLARRPAGGYRVALDGPGGGEIVADRVYNCTYAHLNALLAASGVPRVPLRHELTELALVEPPPRLARAAVTVMCGPFFSCMPFPSRGLYSLSHVRYTPHGTWDDRPGGPYADPEAMAARIPRRSRFAHMVRDAARYLPLMRECRYVESLWAVKTILPRSAVDDSRPILVHTDAAWPGLACIIGGKLDNVYDMLESRDLLPAKA